MFRSITISDNLQWSAKCKIPYLPILGISIIEFLVLSTFLCYGVYYSAFLRIGFYDFHNGFWTPVLFAAFWNIADPWSRSLWEYYEEKREEVYRYVISIGILVQSVSLIFASVPAPNILCQIIFYGICGGICTSIITSQLKFATSGLFENDPKIFEAIRQVSRAISLLFMPHVILFLAEYYGIFASQFIMAAIILNVIPACLLIKSRHNNLPTSMNRYETFPGLSIPLQDINVKQTNIDEDSSSEEEDTNSIENDLNGISSLTPNERRDIIETLNGSIHAYYKNIGVNILPQIPEEDEDDTKSIDVINIKRVSRISMKLEEINETNKREGIRTMLNSNEKLVNMLQQSQISLTSGNDQNTCDVENKSINGSFLKNMKTVHRTNCICCTPYRKYLWRKRIRNFKDLLLDNIIKPLYFSLKDVQFYLALISKTTLVLTSAIVITIFPFVQRDIYVNAKTTMTSNDASFLLSIIAFAWCFFLIGAPVIIKWSTLQTKIAFVVGLSVCSFSTVVMARNLTTDLITLICLLYGFGYGIISFCEESVYRSFLGVRKWTKVQGPLSTLSGLFVILLYYFMSIYRLHSYSLFVIAFFVYSLNAAAWTFIPIIKFCIIFISKNCIRNKDILY